MSNYFFVYGTLRPGEIRWHVIGPAVVGEPKCAVLQNSAIFNMGSFPALVMNMEGSVIGELVQISPNLIERITALLDQIEGYYPNNPNNSLYIRSIKTVTTEDGPVEAWVYEAGEEIKNLALDYVGIASCIESGDWKQR